MKKLGLLLMFLLAMTMGSYRIFAQSVTITLMPGWNWISIPLMDTLDFETALGSFSPASGDIVQSQWSNAVYMGNGQWRGQISQFYPGYGYKYYSNRPMPVTVTFTAQQPAPQVVVTTSEPMLITAISAMCGGGVTVSDGTYILVKGLCWAAHENPTTNDDFYQEAESGVGSFAISMTDLNMGTTYYVRAYAVTPNGTVYGDQKVFTTQDGIPTLTTTDVTNITGESATCGGNITDDDGLSVIARGVCWSTSPNPTVADSLTEDGSGTGDFISSITGLNVNTTYYVRSYAITVAGTGFGEQKIFTTRDGIPTLTTADITDITGESAISGGDITDDGGLSVIARGVCWSTSPNPTIADQHTVDGSGIGSFSSNITGLSRNTTYYVRAYATNSNTTVYGNEISFTTLGIPTGAINGLFSVSANQQVYFSQGNLQYIGSAATPYWKFADNQWDYLGDNGQAGTSQNIDRDLFGWGTSGYNHGANCYQPWSRSTNSSDYYAYGNSTYNLNDQTGQADWGYNAISNGGNEENQWRTLTHSEWGYILNGRTTTSGIRYAKANVNNVNGVILLPDDWNNNTYSLNNTNTSDASYSSNIITAEDWTGVLEVNGVAFLPAAGSWDAGYGVHSVGSAGSYWPSSRVGNDGAYIESFTDSYIHTTNGTVRYAGKSVRLVRVVE